MAQPSAADVRYDSLLTQVSEAYVQQESNFIAARAFPIVRVARKTGVYRTYTQADFWRMDAQVRAPGAESAGSGFGVSTGTYNCDVFALHKDIDHQTRANTDAPMDPDRDATMWLTQQMLIAREYQFTAHFFTTSVWTGGLTGTDITVGSQWNNAASTPIEDVREQAVSIAEKTGYLPNTLIVGPEVDLKLKDHPDIVDRFKYTDAGGVATDEFLAKLFGVQRYLVPRGVRNSAAEGATASNAFLYGKHALLVYSAPNPGLLQPSGGYIFTWSELRDCGFESPVITKFWMQNIKADRVEAEWSMDLKVIAANCGCLFSSVVA